MTLRFNSPSLRGVFDSLIEALDRVGYRGELVEREYTYSDFLVDGTPKRSIHAALFGRTPPDYDTAVIGIAVANGAAGAELVNSHRSLGAPMIIEVAEPRIGIWSVGRKPEQTRRHYSLDMPEFRAWAKTHRAELAPGEFLRTKNLKRGPSFIQGSLFAGLIPELEEHIAETLEPLLTAAFRAGIRAYKESAGHTPPENRLFKLAFSMLAGKVFADRKHDDFSDLGPTSDADDVLERVWEHYGEVGRSLLLNRNTREAIFDRIWTKMDFRNLSVEVLAQIWSRTLVSEDTRKRLGIHRTPRSIVKYIVEQIPFDSFDIADRHVLEPCSGAATFLVGAMDKMRDSLEHLSQLKRHSYFKKMLEGFERDPFGAEISRLCLALADYPNANGWKIVEENVFLSQTFDESLSHARIVLCNPPFEKFDEDDALRRTMASIHQPAALLQKVLANLHPEGVIGFVLPRIFLDGRAYAQVRQQLVERFGHLDIVALPDKGWDFADQETALLIATDPTPHRTSSVSFGRVREKTWPDFDLYQEVPELDSSRKSAQEAGVSLAIPELRAVWDYVSYCGTLGDIAEVHKGLEWNNLTDNLDKIVKDKEFPCSKKGLAPRERRFCAYECPKTAWLSIAREHLYRPNSLSYPWDKPKIIINKTAKGRGAWRLSAFADTNGLYCGETFLVIWPKDERDLWTLTAILNSPLGNAFVTTHEGKREFAVSTIRSMPVPKFSSKLRAEIADLIQTYLATVDSQPLQTDSAMMAADQILRKIDALVLSAYKLPPKLERRLLDFFRGFPPDRKVPFTFADYFPVDFKPCFSLLDWLSGRHARATAKRFREQSRDLPNHIANAIRNIE